jgi:hypothetical protein
MLVERRGGCQGKEGGNDNDTAQREGGGAARGAKAWLSPSKQEAVVVVVRRTRHSGSFIVGCDLD